MWRKDKKEKIKKGYKETLWYDTHVDYIDGVDGFMGVYIKIYQVVLKNIYSWFYVNYN